MRLQRITYKLASKLESDIDDTFPVNRATGVVECWLEASSFYGVDGCLSKTMAQITGDSYDLYAARG